MNTSRNDDSFEETPRQHLYDVSETKEKTTNFSMSNNASAFWRLSKSSKKYESGLYDLISAIAKKEEENIRDILNQAAEERPLKDFQDREPVSTLIGTSEDLLPDKPIEWTFQLFNQNPTFASGLSYLDALLQNFEKVNQLTGGTTSLKEIQEYVRQLEKPILIGIANRTPESPFAPLAPCG